MTIDIARVRRDTPGVANVIHFNNAGASLPPAPVTEAVVGHLRLEAAIGGYEAQEAAAPALRRTYEAIARMLGCATAEVALVENATRAWDMAFYALSFRSGDRILTAAPEYASNVIAFLQIARRTGARIDVVPSDAAGAIDLAALERMIDDRVKLIALTHVPTNGGLVQPAADVGRLARAAGVPFLLDACQSAGQMPLDVGALGCDMLSATGRKYMRGPRGTGFLYVRRAVIERLEPPFLDLEAARWTAPDRYDIVPDARRFETWERNVAGLVGLGVATDYALSLGLEAIRERTVALAECLRARLAAIAGIRVRDLGHQRCGIVSFSHDRVDAKTIKDRLNQNRVNVTTSSPAATLYDATARALPTVVRASVHYYNDEDEIDRVVGLVRASVAEP